MNPIFIEYYPHERCDCYKIKMPWPRYCEEKMVLCRVDEGIETAMNCAREAIGEHLEEVLKRPLQSEPEEPFAVQAIHHLNGDPPDNRPENLRLVDVGENF